MNKSLPSSIKSTADQEKSWASVSHIKYFIYLCKHEMRFGLESIRIDYAPADFFVVVALFLLWLLVDECQGIVSSGDASDDAQGFASDIAVYA